MAEFTTIGVVEVSAGGNIPFTETAVKGSSCVYHRDGAGAVTLRGLTNQCYARFKVSYGGNIAVTEDGTAEEISVAITVNGEPLESAKAIFTPAAVAEYGNVFTAVFVLVPKGCCTTVAVENTSSQSIDVANSNLIVERVA